MTPAARPAAARSFALARLGAQLRPFRLHWFPTLRSTNDHAAVLRRRGKLFAPAAVLAGRQTAGRGRGAHAWWSSPGCVTVTFVLPADGQEPAHRLPLLAGLAVRAAVAELTGNDGVQLKWPNDVLYGGRKLAGLLCERVAGADLVGLGLNVNLDPATAPPDIRERVGALSAVAGRELDLTDALACVARHLYRVWSRRGEQPFPEVLREYDAHHTLVGRTVSVIVGEGQPAVRGRCEGLDEMGRLVVRSKTGVERVIAGHVQML